MLSSRSLTLTVCSSMLLQQVRGATAAVAAAPAVASSSLADRAAAAVAPLLARATGALEPHLVRLGVPMTAVPALLATLPLLLLALCWLAFRSPAPLRRPSRSAKVAAATGGALPQTHAVHHATYDTDVVIVGAGCAGASLGAALGKRGYRVVVVERDLTEPDRIVGELLQPSGCSLLREMGLPECLEGYDAQRVTAYGIFQGDTMLRLDYPKDPATGKTIEGRAFHNGKLLMALREAVRRQPSAELRQGSVGALLEDEKSGRVTGVSYKTASGETRTVTAPLTVVCDGLFGHLRKTLTSNTHQQRSRFLGLVLKDVDYPLAEGGNVILAEPTPILLYPISSNEGRMLIDFPGEMPTNEEGALTRHLLSHTMQQLPACARPSFERAVKEGAFKVMPNRQLGARPIARPGTLLIGDALNVRHPLTGGGMTVAFTDVQNVLDLCDARVSDWNDLRAVDNMVKEHYATRSAPVAAINILADALYDVFGSKYASLREACFDYLSRGGERAEGPIRLLSGVSRSQALLVTHFFAVAFHGVGRMLWPVPTPARIVKSFLMLRDANIIILPLLLQEHPGWGFRALAAVLRTVFWIPYRSYVFPKAD